jgi:hypothetical protein
MSTRAHYHLRAITATSAQPSTSARDEADSDHADDPGA